MTERFLNKLKVLKYKPSFYKREPIDIKKSLQTDLLFVINFI